MGNRLLALWYRMTLKKKLYVIIGSVGMIMGASIFINLRVVYVFIDGARIIMDDNLSCYKFQESMQKESEVFARLMASDTAENRTAYLSACQETRVHLTGLPYAMESPGILSTGTKPMKSSGKRSYPWVLEKRII